MPFDRILAPYILLALLSAVLVLLMIRVGTLDHPGGRSSHSRPTPKGGGVGIVGAFAVGMMLNFTRLPLAPAAGLLVGALGIAAISYRDDVRTFSFAFKLAAQLVAAGLLVACGVRLHGQSWLKLPGIAGEASVSLVTIAWVVFVTNAVNFIDGLNGLASGCVALACLAISPFAPPLMEVSALSLTAGIAGFLPFNYPRASIFMGDVGSQCCGFVVAALGILVVGNNADNNAILFMPSLLAGILFDVAFTLARRAIAGERITQAHRGHLYQIANRAGMAAWKVTLVYWGMTVWGGACWLVLPGDRSPYGPGMLAFLILLPQCAWLGLVALMASRRPIGKW